MSRIVEYASVERISQELRQEMHKRRRQELGVILARGEKPLEHQSKRRGKLVDFRSSQ